MKRFDRFLLCAVLALASALTLRADGGAYGANSPYSIFGIGDMAFPGTSYNYGMAGVGIAARNNRFINIVNPAAVTARDSLSFMMDFSFYGNNILFAQNTSAGRLKAASNVYGIKDCVMSFPIWRSSAMMLGITPLSSTGYSYKSSLEGNIIGDIGNLTMKNTGKGSLYEVFVAGGVTFWKRFSVGAQFDFYFGSVYRDLSQEFSKSTIVGTSKYSTFTPRGVGGKFGLQYEQPLGKKARLVFGATYRMSNPLKGTLSSYSPMDTMAVVTDTLGNGINPRIASEKGIGISFRYNNKFTAEFDYTRSDWRNSGINDVFPIETFSLSTSQAFRLGFEYIPNRNDIRYYMKRVSYRAGLYYRNEYYRYCGMPVNSMGLTIGATFPIIRSYSCISMGIDFGQRGSLQGDSIRERYINFTVGVNLFDIWFQKYKYD